jgi:hypothetical protein
MNAKEKARELVDKMYGETPIMINITLVEYAQNTAKQCALISISDKIEELMWLNLLITTDNPIKEVMNNKVEELLQVEKEIEAL